MSLSDASFGTNEVVIKQLARAVMQRDLAVCRAKERPSPSTAVVSVIRSTNEVTKTDLHSDAEINIDMKDGVAVQTTTHSRGVSVESPPKSESGKVEVQPAEDPDEKHNVEMLEAEPMLQSVDQNADDVKPTVDLGPSIEPREDSSRTSEPALLVDTKTDARLYPTLDSHSAHPDDEAPDTGTYSNTADLDSLFNDPTSAVDAVDSAEAPSFDMDAGTSASFDFDSFNSNIDTIATDNDSISALLPGLEDYANTQPVGSAESNVNALFATDVPVDGLSGEGGDMPGSGEQHDSTFDDLMDFNDFNTGDYAGSGEDGTSNNQFDFAFE